MKRFSTVLCIILCAMNGFSQTGRSILAKMDDAMVFEEGRMNIVIEDRRSDGSVRFLAADVFYARDSGTLIDFVSPERELGKRILMIGNSMWMGMPNINRSIRLSGKDSFMGTSFTNDDVMNFDKSDDYDASILSEDHATWTLELQAKKKGVPYPRMIVVVGKDYLPKTMRLFVLSGAEAKTIEYSFPKMFDGKLRPSVMKVTDSMTSGSSTTVRFESVVATKIDRSRLSPSGFMK